MILARLLICLALFCSPFVLLVIASRRAEGMIWLMFPVVGGIPALLGALLVFAPLESYLGARGLGHLKNVAVPLAGALLIVIATVAFLGASGSLSKVLGRISSGGINVIGPLVLWSVLGAIWGVLWRLSDWIAMRMGLS